MTDQPIRCENVACPDPGDHAHTIGNAETVLLVDDDQAQVMERDVVLKERVCANDHVQIAACEPVQDDPPVFDFVAARKHCHPDAGGSEQWFKRGAMLAC